MTVEELRVKMTGMGVRSWSRAFAVVALAAALGGLGCKDGDDGQDGVIAGNGANLQPKDGPVDETMIHSSSPGLEPPLTGPTDMQSPGMNVGSGGSGSDSFGNPSGAAAGAGGSMSTMGTAGGAAPGASAGSGGNTAAGAPANEDPGARDGGTADAGSDVCANAPECGLDAPCADSSQHCIALDLCSHPICISPEAACMAECNATECALLESYPEQIACN